jgi:hypothetical protein
MASTHKSLRSSTADKRPTTAIADGQIALNTNTTSPGLFFKDSTGATIIKVGPVHVGATAPNATPAAGGSSGNSTGEVWLDTSLTPNGVKIWNGSAWVNATPAGSTSVQGLLELATNAETQTGSDTARAVTPAGLQSKVSDSTSTTSSTTIASSTAVKSAYDLANAALPASGGTITGELLIGDTGSLVFEGSTTDNFETTLAVVDPTAARTITFPDRTGTVITTGDTGTVTSTMIVDGTIVNADVNASAAIAGTKISPDFGGQTVVTTGIFSAAGGSAAAPSIAFTGDTNTGVYSPGADQVAISTNGTQRLLLDDSGNVTVVGSVQPKLRVQSFGDYCEIKSDGNGSVILDADPDNSASNSLIRFLVDGGEKARITSDGKLGLGTSSVSTNVDIVDATRANIAIKKNGLGIEANSSLNSTYDVVQLGAGGSFASYNVETVTADTHIGHNFYRHSGGTYKYKYADAALRLRFNSSQGYTYFDRAASGSADSDITFSTSLTIDDQGRVGIGTTSPQQPLHINNAGSSACRLILQNTGSTVATSTQVWSQNNDLVFDTNNTERLRITSDGKLGLGTSSPAYQLDLGGGTTVSSRIQLQRGSDDTNQHMRLGWGGIDMVRANVALASAQTSFSLKQVGSDGTRTCLHVDPSGRVGIGTNDFAPASSYYDDLVVKNATAGTGCGLTLISNATNGFSAVDFADTDAAGRGRITYSHADDSLRVDVAGSEAFRVDSSRRILVGTSTESSNNLLVVEGNTTSDTGGAIAALKRGTDVSGINSGDTLGILRFTSKDSHVFADVAAYCDGTPGASDYPGRLVFSTTADGASSPTERMRINNAGTTTLTAAAATAPFIAKISTSEVARIDDAGRLLVGVSNVTGTSTNEPAKFAVRHTSAEAITKLAGNFIDTGNGATSGTAQKYEIIRHYPVVSLGTKLIIPFISQLALNQCTHCSVKGFSTRFNNSTPLGFEINFAVGHINSLNNLQSWGGAGNYSSIAINGMNIEITFTTAYTSATVDGLMAHIEYMCYRAEDSIDVANIAMN